MRPGVVIERFEDEFSAPRKSGMLEGDVLLRWSRREASGELESPFDLYLVTVDQLVRGPVKFEGLRGTESHVWTVTNQWWGSDMRPNFSGTTLAEYLEGQELVKKGELREAVKRWRSGAAGARESGPPWLESWFLAKAAELMAKKQQWKEADDLYREAIGGAAPAGPAVAAQLLTEWANTETQRSQWDRAATHFLEAAGEGRKAGKENLAGDALVNLGLMERGRGELSKSEEYYRQGLEIRERLEPGSIHVGELLIDMGITCYDRGDLAKAENHYRGALEIWEKQAPNSNGLAYLLDDIAEVALARGDVERAEDYYRKSLAIEEHVDPGTIAHATILSDLAKAVVQRGDTREAEELLRRSLEIKLKIAPGSPEEAETRQGLGDLALLRDDWAGAETIYLETLALREKLVPKGLPTAETLNSMGNVALHRGDVEEAESYFRRALAIREELSPGSARHAESLAAMAGIMRRKQQLDAAGKFYVQALNALESQTARLGGSNDARAGFRARHQNFYRDYAELLLMQHRDALALEVVERGRARTLMETLAAAHVDIRNGVDPALLEMERSLASDIRAKSERRAGLLTDQHADEQITAIEKDISRLTQEYQNVEGQIRAGSPAFVALTQPEPLSAKAIQRELLDPGTLLLEYFLADNRSYVFAVTPDSLQAYELPNRAEIRKQTQRVYDLLTERNRPRKGESEQQRAERWSSAEKQYKTAAALLSRTLLAPVASQIKDKRLVMVGDGILNYLSLAALPEPGAAGKADAPLAVSHEIISLPSASILAVLRQQSKDRKPAPRAVAVLADPVFDKNDRRVGARASKVAAASPAHSSRMETVVGLLSASPSSDLLARSADDLGLRRNGQLALTRLRYTRLEADAIRAVSPATQVLEALDFKANRAIASSPELANYRIVHFATHGLLNSTHPELSGLVLSLVDQKGQPQDGFLTLQDIYNMNLPAELVVLSACETGLGKEISGEGLVGLTRGFMYAGASRVVASLWKVSDVATAQLMAEFYRAMEKDGMAPAAALRAAQVKMWKQKRWSSPYYWAAFQIQGEWR
ncbi:MAG TPA: CHAT domain-containing protein [Candidatus Angelobacter sp.]